MATPAARIPEVSNTQRPPRVSWAQFHPLFCREFHQGQHVTIIGPTNSGKTTLALEVADVRSYVMFLATKPRDPLIESLTRERNFQVVRDLDEVELMQDEDAGGEVQHTPRFHRYVYWPRGRSGDGIREKLGGQQEAIREALNYCFDGGGWAVVADELTWLIDKLSLGDELEAYWYQGRTLRVSLIAGAQRPAWVPRAAYSQAQHIFLFKTADREDIRRLGDIAGADVDRVRYEVARLEPFEFLYIQPHVAGRPDGVLLRSSVDPARARPLPLATTGRGSSPPPPRR